jgi:hypothetical protein
VLATAVCLVWTGFEWGVTHDEFWGSITLAMLAYAVWSFFIAYRPPRPAPAQGEQTREADNGKPEA